jgi:hypothetical protein
MKCKKDVLITNTGVDIVSMEDQSKERRQLGTTRFQICLCKRQSYLIVTQIRFDFV